jgi:hypothetical protein
VVTDPTLDDEDYFNRIVVEDRSCSVRQEGAAWLP